MGGQQRPRTLERGLGILWLDLNGLLECPGRPVWLMHGQQCLRQHAVGVKAWALVLHTFAGAQAGGGGEAREALAA